MVFVQVLAAAISALVWMRTIQELRRGRLPLEARPHLAVRWDPLIVLVAFLGGAMLLPSATLLLLEELLGPAEGAPLRGIQAQCLWAASVLLFVPVVLELSARLSRNSGDMLTERSDASEIVADSTSANVSDERLSRVEQRNTLSAPAANWWRIAADFGLQREGLARDLRAGLWGFFLCLIPVYLTEAPLRHLRKVHPVLQTLLAQPDFATIAWVTLSAVILAPLVEELLYRVVLQGFLADRMNPLAAIVMSAFVFSFAHVWPDPLPLFPLALILGYVYERRRSYVAIVFLHASFNAANLLLALAQMNHTQPGPAH